MNLLQQSQDESNERIEKSNENYEKNMNDYWTGHCARQGKTYGGNYACY